MKFTYRDNEYVFPVSLDQIKLKQRIEFDQLYGSEIRDLQEQTFKFDEKGNELPVDELELTFFNGFVATRNFSFFTGIPLDEVEKNISIEDVLTIYFSCFHQIYLQQDEIELKDSYVWNDEVWKLEAPELTFESKLTFNEFITSKQIIKQMHELGAGNWDVIPYLASIYLRKDGEKFEESWLSEGSERLELMKDLPMDIAVAVAFFLQSSMSMYLKTLASSQEEEAEKDLT